MQALVAKIGVERFEAGVIAQAVVGRFARPAGGVEGRPQRAELGLDRARPVDESAAIVRQRTGVGIKRVEEQAARRRIGADVAAVGEEGRVDRADRDGIDAGRRRPAREIGQRAQIAEPAAA